MNQLLFGAALVTVLAVFALSTLQFARKGFEFWPPPTTSSWQSQAFRTLFRVFFVSLTALSILEFDATQSTWRYALGALIAALGFGLALRWTNFLGWGNAFGSRDGLKTEGIYQYSRNPIYAISIVGMMGWAVLINSWMVTTLLVLWACLYVAAPFLEEPWMRKRYGEAFSAYCSQVPRYASAGSVTNHLFEQLELKIPPLAITLICAGIMYASAATFPHISIVPKAMRVALAIVANLLAGAVLLAAVESFRRHKTTLNPLNPNSATSLVTTGIYTYSRNPMYLSMFLTLFGWGFLLGQLASLVGLALHVLTITRFQILPEERLLERKFGSHYAGYLGSSSRWFGIHR